jgi:hypothetical protein
MSQARVRKFEGEILPLPVPYGHSNNSHHAHSHSSTTPINTLRAFSLPNSPAPKVPEPDTDFVPDGDKEAAEFLNADGLYLVASVPLQKAYERIPNSQAVVDAILSQPAPAVDGLMERSPSPIFASVPLSKIQARLKRSRDDEAAGDKEARLSSLPAQARLQNAAPQAAVQNMEGSAEEELQAKITPAKIGRGQWRLQRNINAGREPPVNGTEPVASPTSPASPNSHVPPPAPGSFDTVSVEPTPNPGKRGRKGKKAGREESLAKAATTVEKKPSAAATSAGAVPTDTGKRRPGRPPRSTPQ